MLDDLGPTVALLGRNGAGKTNILRAIADVAKGALSLGSAGEFQDHPWGSAVTLECETEGVRIRYRLELLWPEGGARNSYALDEDIWVAEDGENWGKLVERRGGAARFHENATAREFSIRAQRRFCPS